MHPNPTPRPLRLPLFGAAVLLAASLVATLPASAASDPACQRYPLNLDNVWLHSVAAYGEGVLAVDPAERRVLNISPLANVEDPADRVTEAFVALEGRLSSDAFVPTLIQRLDGNFLISNGTDELLEVKPSSAVLGQKAHGPEPRSLEVVQAVKHLEASRRSSEELIGVFAWAATADDHLLALANVGYPDDSFERGFVWLERSNPKYFHFIRKVDVDSEEATFYLVMHPYLATIGNKGYFLSMEQRPTIYEHDGEKTRRLGRPSKFRTRPTLPPRDGASTMPALYSTLEQSVTPVGLYAWANDLWLLSREPKVEGGTTWLLYRIDPGDSSTRSHILAKFYLPTDAAHLALAFGGDFLSILEKGTVKALGRQDVNSLLQIPNEWLSASSLVLRRPTAASRCD